MTASKIRLITTMLIFGTIGVFVRYIPLPSSMIAMVRGIIGSLFLLVVIAASGKRMSAQSIKRNAVLLIASGAAIGFNWILLFEAYRYATVAIATLCYYLAPVFVMILSPFILKESLTGKKIVCILAALVGMVLISGIVPGGTADLRQGRWIGILLGIGAAVLYASVMLMNKFLRDISSYDSTIVQLSSAAMVLIPYVFLTENPGEISWTAATVILILIVGIIHTGVAYWLYFGSMKDLPAQTIALLSYIDPATAILLSVFVLRESMNLWSVAGAVLILGATLVGERD